ncbi:aminopeptidase N-like [Styela clava]
MGDSGFYLSKSRVIILVVVVALLLLIEGLLIGLVARPTCNVVVQDETTTKSTTTKSSTASTPITEAPTGPWTAFRISHDHLPISYNIDIRPVLEMNADGKYMFYGTSSVTFSCETATKYIILHSRKLVYTQSQVTLTENENTIPIKSMMYYQPNEFMVFESENLCEVGKIYTLTVTNYESELSDDLTGIYRSEYYNPAGELRVVAVSQMETTGARETFPCFDEPGFKANFTITLWHKANSGYFAVSNMPETSHKLETIDGDLWNSTTFAETVPMSTYLLALVVCDFSYVETKSVSGVETRTYARSAAVDNGEAEYASIITPRILEFFQGYFSVPYPLPKSDQAAAPDFGAGAMENWGLVLYRDVYLLYDEDTSSVFDKQTVTRIISHELGHQWFGNLVSPVWWDDLWLNEGFASYVEYIGQVNVQPTWKANELFVSDDMQSALEADGVVSSHPLVYPVNSLTEISAQFDDISYEKGASILRMINSFMGEDNFVTGLTNYLNELAYQAATHSDLFRFWQEQADTAGLEFPTTLTIILETWTLQMGHPVVNVRKTTTNTYQVTQEYFLFDNNATVVHTPGSETYGYKWYIPFTYKTFNQIGTDNMEETWLEPNQSPLEITESEFILANINSFGFYRVNYDEDTWNKIIAKLVSASFEEIPERSRAQMISDVFNLARPGRLDITYGMDLSKYMIREQEFVPWKVFMQNVKFLEYMLSRTPAYGQLSKHVVQLVDPLYQMLGWEETDKSDAALISRRNMKLTIGASCYYGNAVCISQAKDLFKQWMQNPENNSIISSTYRDDVYCAAIRNGGVEEWNFAWQRHGESTNAQEQISLRYGMSCSKEPWILTRYMEYCIDPTVIRTQDTFRSCMNYIGGEDYGRDLAWGFLVENWDALVNVHGGSSRFSRLIDSISNRLSTEYDLQLLENFRDGKNNLGSASQSIDKAIERTKLNIAWRAINEEKITAWLATNV